HNLGDTLRRKGCGDSFLHWSMLRRNHLGMLHRKVPWALYFSAFLVQIPCLLLKCSLGNLILKYINYLMLSLAVADLEGVELEMLKRQYKNDVELEYHVEQLKVAVLEEVQWSNDYYYIPSLSTEEKYTSSFTKHFAARYHIEGIEDMILNRWSKKIHLYHIDALNGIHHCDYARNDFFKAEMGNRSSHKVYSDKRIISVVKVNVKKK
ncbi:hypothetical protein Tco_1390320, partial [Tanacetum coccineum]